MNKLKQFRDYCNFYQKWTEQETNLSKLGITLEDPFLEPVDRLLSLIPELLFTETGVELFWDLMGNVKDFTDEIIDQLWDNLQEHQL